MNESITSKYFIDLRKSREKIIYEIRKSSAITISFSSFRYDLSAQTVDLFIEILNVLPEKIFGIDLDYALRNISTDNIIKIFNNLHKITKLSLYASLETKSFADKIKIITALPPKLSMLNLGGNSLGQLPSPIFLKLISSLPQDLIELELHQNDLTTNQSLPELAENLIALPKSLSMLNLGSNGILDGKSHDVISFINYLPEGLVTLDFLGRGIKKTKEDLQFLLLELSPKIKRFRCPDSSFIDVDEFKANTILDQVRELTLTNNAQGLEFAKIKLPLKLDEPYLNLLINVMERQNSALAYLTCGLLLQGLIPNKVEKKDDLAGYMEIRMQVAIDFYTKASEDKKLRPLAEFLLWEIKLTSDYPSVCNRLAQYDVAPHGYLSTYQQFSHKGQPVSMPLLKELGIFSLKQAEIQKINSTLDSTIALNK